MNNSLARHDWYQVLLDDLTAIAVESVAASNLAYIEGKWLFGQRIAQENENFKREKIYGKKIVATVAESLKRSSSDIWRCLQFYKKYPAPTFSQACGYLPEGKNLTWNKIITQYLPALPNGEKEERPRLVKCKKCGGWYLEGDNLCHCQHKL